MLAKISLLLLIVISSVVAQSQSAYTNTPQSTSPSEVPTVSLCALLSKPTDYHGKEIRVRAEYNLGFEWSYFADDSCKDFAVETTPYLTANVVWAEFGKYVEASSKPEISQKLIKARSLCYPSGWCTSRTKMVVSGKFFKADDSGYGHLGRYAFEFIVSKVEEVGDTKILAP